MSHSMARLNSVGTYIITCVFSQLAHFIHLQISSGYLSPSDMLQTGAIALL